MLDIEIIVFMSVIKTSSKAELGKAKYMSCLQECDLLFLSLFRIAVEKLHEMDDAFRKQLESVLAAHQEELLQLASEKEKQIEAANEKVMLILNLCLLVFAFFFYSCYNSGAWKSRVCIYLANLWTRTALF